MRAFDQQGFELVQLAALALLVIGLAVRLLQQPRHGAGIAVRQLVECAALRHQGGGGTVGGSCGLEVFGKIDLDAEAPRHVRVMLLHLVIALFRAYQHELEVQRQQLRLHGAAVARALGGVHVVDTQLAGA
ncbi:hypothetical protein D3C72_1080580 [compost metagenome]